VGTDPIDNTLLIHPNPNTINIIIASDGGSWMNNLCLNGWVIMVDDVFGYRSGCSPVLQATLASLTFMFISLNEG
jgi:hypothetical protein